MNGVLQDGAIAFFAAVGMTTVVWLLAGALAHATRQSVPGLLLVLPLTGAAPALEADMRELRRLQGRLPGSEIVLVDCGLDAEARDLAAYLAAREEDARVTDAEHLGVGA